MCSLVSILRSVMISLPISKKSSDSECRWMRLPCHPLGVVGVKIDVEYHGYTVDSKLSRWEGLSFLAVFKRFGRGQFPWCIGHEDGRDN